MLVCSWTTLTAQTDAKQIPVCKLFPWVSILTSPMLYFHAPYFRPNPLHAICAYAALLGKQAIAELLFPIEIIVIRM
jgi:hypothetical protein